MELEKRRTQDDSVPSNSLSTNFNQGQLAKVGGWIREISPNLTPEVVLGASQRFLEELRHRQPELFDRLSGETVNAGQFESALLMHTGVQLDGAQIQLRESLALRRVELFLRSGTGPSLDATASMAKIKGLSQLYYRRLVEGRIDDDELIALLKRVQQGPASAKPVATAKPQALTAAEIVSEFSRRHQSGSTLARLRAYTIEGTMKNPGGEEQTLQIFRLRPDRFRMQVRVNEMTRLIVAGDGVRYWYQAAGSSPEYITAEQVGSRIQLAEFTNLLFGDERCVYERVEDGEREGKKTYRVAIKRPDSSRYVAIVDAETFHEIGEEFPDGARATYSDFREVAGLTLPFTEETVDKEGGRHVFHLTRFSANPGLVVQFFQPVGPSDLNFFSIEHLSSRGPVAMER
jgi:hypothetical protein